MKLYILDVIRNKVLELPAQRSATFSHAPVVQSAGDYHRQIGETIFGIPQHILDDARAFSSGDGMFHAHANVRDALIDLFLGVG
jgi:hypothetical protein